MRYAVVDTAIGLVVNVILWDGVAPYDPGEGMRLVQSDTLNIGDVATA